MVFNKNLIKYAKYAGLAAIVGSLTACASNLAGTADENKRLKIYTDKVVDEFFVEEYKNELKGLPVSFAVFEAPMEHAIGFARTKTIDAMWTGHGYEPITVFNINKQDKLTDDFVVHEFIHQAVAQGLVDMDEFNMQWGYMMKDPQYTATCKYVNTQIDKNYGGLDMSEEDIIEERMTILSKSFCIVPEAFPKGMFDFYAQLITVLSEEEKKKLAAENQPKEKKEK